MQAQGELRPRSVKVLMSLDLGGVDALEEWGRRCTIGCGHNLSVRGAGSRARAGEISPCEPGSRCSSESESAPMAIRPGSGAPVAAWPCFSLRADTFVSAGIISAALLPAARFAGSPDVAAALGPFDIVIGAGIVSDNILASLQLAIRSPRTGSVAGGNARASMERSMQAMAPVGSISHDREQAFEL